jgi:plasmid stability protein
MARVTAVVPDDLERKARAKAALEKRSLPDVVREFLRRYVADGLPGYREENGNAKGS